MAERSHYSDIPSGKNENYVSSIPFRMSKCVNKQRETQREKERKRKREKE